MRPAIDLDGLGLDSGGHLLIDRALSTARPGEGLQVRGHHPALAVHLAAWCRAEGHRYQPDLTVVKGSADAERWGHAERAGQAAATVSEFAKREWGEVMQLLAAQAADEARHMEIFTRRALLHRAEMGVSGAGGRSSLQSLLDEPDFTLASFLLSVLGEGSFLDLLRFIQRHAPDQATAGVTMLAGRDEARHVAFGVAHTAHVVRTDPAHLTRLRAAVERRHSVLVDTAGLNKQVFDSLVVLAAGSWTPAALARGWDEVQRLQATMDEGRQRRLEFIGFPADEAAAISALHTRNFM